jgi:hypothetical protein
MQTGVYFSEEAHSRAHDIISANAEELKLKSTDVVKFAPIVKSMLTWLNPEEFMSKV